MKIDADVRKCVVFLGHVLNPAKPETFKASATGFLLGYDGLQYLVTSAHVAAQFDAPFNIRFNDRGSGTGIFDVDPDEESPWFVHEDPSVDVAAMPFPGFGNIMDHLAVHQDVVMTPEMRVERDIGVGDFAYVVGLFKLLAGKARNFPIVHRGSIAAMPSDELIPVTDWRDERKTTLTRGYLVEATNLRGLSGSPVLARSTIVTTAPRIKLNESGSLEIGKQAALSSPSSDVYLMGVWAGSWDAKADQVLSLDGGEEVRVPVWLGIVTPSECLLELLNAPECTAHRADLLEKIEAAKAAAEAAKPD